MPAYDNVTIRAHWQDRGANRGASETQERMQRLRDASERVNSAQARMGARADRVREAHDRMGRSAERLSGTLGQMVPLIAGIFSGAVVTQAALLAVEMAGLAAQADLTRETFDRLATKAGTTGVTQLERMREAVGGTLSDLELMQRVGAAVDAGLTFDQAITALEFLRRYSLAFGKDFNQLTQTIFTGLSRGSVLMLDDAGLIINASDKIFDGLNEVEKKSALVAEAIRLMSEKMEVLPEIQSNAATEANNLAVAFENLKIATGEAIGDNVRRGLSVAIAIVNELEQGVRLFGNLSDAALLLEGLRLSARDFGFTGPVIIEPDQDRIYQEIARQAAIIDKNQGKAKEQVEAQAEAWERIRKAQEKLAALPSFTRDLSGLPADKGYALEAEAAPVRDLVDFKAPVEFVTTITTRLDEAALREVDETLEMLTKARSAQIAAEIAKEDPKHRGLFDFSARVSSPQDASARFVQDVTDQQNKAQFFENSADALTKGAEAFDQSTLVTISAIENLVNTLDFLPEEFDSVATAAANIARAMATGNPFDAISAGIGVISTVVGLFRSESERWQQKQEEHRRAMEAYHREQEKLNTAIEDAIDLTGKFARSLARMNDLNLLAAYQERVDALFEFEPRLDPAIRDPANLEKLAEGIRARFIDLSQTETHASILALNEAITIAQNIEERKADAEIAAREEQAEIIIEAIERQREAVLQKLIDAEEAQRVATLRAVGAQFDFLEAELRARYQPQLQSVRGDEAATLVLRERVFADIERLRRGEAAAGTSALQDVSTRFSDARDRTNALYDGVIQAVRDAVPDLSRSLAEGIRSGTQDFLTKWEEIGEAIDPLSTLPPDLQEVTREILSGLTSAGNTISNFDWPPPPESLTGFAWPILPTFTWPDPPEDITGFQVPVYMPEGLQVSTHVPEDARVPAYVPEGLQVQAYVPEGLQVPVYIPEDVVDMINRIGSATLPTEAPENPPPNDRLIDYDYVAQVFRTLDTPEELIQKFLETPDAYRTDQSSRAGKLAISESMTDLPSNVIALPDVIAPLDRIAAAIESQDNYWSETADPRLMNIETNTGVTATNTGELSNIKGHLDTIANNTNTGTVLGEIRGLLSTIESVLRDIEAKNYDVNVTVEDGGTSNFDVLSENTPERNAAQGIR